MSNEADTIQALRRDIALQLSRMYRRSGDTQVGYAQRLGIPQPTLSKISNGRVQDLSIELLLRAATRAGLALTLQTGRDAKEAGAFRSGPHRRISRANESSLGTKARKALSASENRLTPTERLEAFLEHNKLVAELHQAGFAAEQRRATRSPHTA